MICVVSQLNATAEYEPFCFASQLCLDVCLDPIIKVLSLMHDAFACTCRLHAKHNPPKGLGP